MFKFPLQFDRIHLEARLSPIPPKSRPFQLFFNEFAPQLKSLSIKQSWDTLFPLNRLPELEELSIYGNLNKQQDIFPPATVPPYLPNLKRAYFYLEGRITTTNALSNFAMNMTTLLKAAPNLEEIVAPKKIDHRDETADSYRDNTANHIFLHMLASDRKLKLLHLKVLRIDAKLMDFDLNMLSRTAPSLPQLETLGIALSGAATRTAVVAVLQNFSPTLKDLSISYSKTHGTRMSLESFFLHESPLRKLEALNLKNYPASVCFLGAIKQLKKFRIEVRNIGDCFDNDRDDFFLQPTPFIPLQNPYACVLGESSKSKQSRRKKDEDLAEPSVKKSRSGFLRVDPSKAHGLTSFHYIHNKEGTQINLYGDRCPFVVTRRIAMRFPQLTHLTLDNMTGDSMTCIIKYLPLLEHLTAVGGFYNDLSIVGASSREEMLRSDFPQKRKLPYIGDLKYLHTLMLSTFSMDSLLWDKTDLLSEWSIYLGIIDCKKLRRLTLGNDNRGNSSMRSKFETAIGDEPILDLIEALNLTYLKTVRCPLTSLGFQKILIQLRERGLLKLPSLCRLPRKVSERRQLFPWCLRARQSEGGRGAMVPTNFNTFVRINRLLMQPYLVGSIPRFSTEIVRHMFSELNSCNTYICTIVING
ncbi:unnamed protein product [Allacma fusca]|uniref:Uncharacterized protein n=1 Tax=Allacma fusca TaxID=39272 RepID=A0A8J2PAS0_9HEXA|nr:unnamed protein product [Allacma fusca]